MLDIDITFEESNFIKEEFMKDKNIRELSLLVEKESVDSVTEDTGEVMFESVDQIVSEQIVSLETGTYNTAKLLEIYNNL
jgi:hypothetical protein